MRKNTVSSFIQKTWQILQDGQYSNILRWSLDGTSFQILNEESLCSEVLPKYFKHSNFSSFIRQLNMYNFHKKKVSDSSLEFYHKLFRKGKKQLLIGIKRKPSEAQIQYGDQLIRKMMKDSNSNSSKPPSRQNSCSDCKNDIIQENFDFHHMNQRSEQKQLYKPVTFDQSYPHDSNQMVFYQFWPVVNNPLQQSNRQNLSNFPPQKKIITNIIIKNPPSCQSANYYQNC